MKRILILLVVLTTLFTSCSKNEDKDKVLIDRITWSGDGGSAGSLVFNYDDKQRVSKMTYNQSSNNTIIYTYTYEKEAILLRIEDGEDIDNISYQLEKGRIVSERINNVTTPYEYNDNKQLTSIGNIYLTWNNNYITRTEEAGQTTTYLYTKTRNKANVNVVGLISGFVYNTYLMDYGYMGRSNNYLLETFDNYDYKYNFDNKGFPIIVTEKYTTGGQTTTTIYTVIYQ